MHLKSIAARAAAVVAISCASITIASPVAYADANPNNRGHHYGQLKHQHPAPAPNPPPAPNSPPVGPNVSHPDAVTAHTNVPAVSNGLMPPAPDLGGKTAPKRAAAAVQPFRDPNLWIVEALLPALVIVWLMLLAASRLLEKRTAVAKEQAG